ncbi:MAG: ABC transporter ATP-binding protein [Armatimonadota bacterium]
MGFGMVTVELRRLSKAFGSRVLFKDVDMKLHSGECLVVTGRNGSGKTTLLRIIAGLARPSRGQVLVADEAGPMDPFRLRRHLGLVAPDLVLYDELTALENLVFFARLRGISPDRARAEALLEFVGLHRRGNELVGTFSSGMKQRLKYAYALQHSPSVLLLDEPTTNLDDDGVEMVRRVVLMQKERGVLILATNSIEEAAYGDKVLRLG